MGELQPGGGAVTRSGRPILNQAAAMLAPAGAPVWLTADSAYYNMDVVERCRGLRWDCSISANGRNKTQAGAGAA